MKKKLAPVRPIKCATCPFRKGSPYQNLAGDLAGSALSEASRICHSTGTNTIGGRTGLAERLCRGARDLQLQLFHSIGFIEAPTDAAWAKKVKEMNI